MKISQIKITNFRIYKGENKVIFSPSHKKNISLIAGRNGFGKTTFLTSLIWGLYGSTMVHVEEKYKQDIRSAGGYDSFCKKNLNNDLRSAYERGLQNEAFYEVSVTLTEVMVPSISCNEITVVRSYGYHDQKENLSILIDNQENELTKEVGFETFINDFILPREIAKFFFFDAEKIVSLAEAKTKKELRALSKAYSEVLGIKKYEELAKHLTALLSKMRREGANEEDGQKIKELTRKQQELTKLIEYNRGRIEDYEMEIGNLNLKIDSLQESLIRQGSSISAERLIELKEEKRALEEQNTQIKEKIKEAYELLPFLIAENSFNQLIEQLKKEENAKISSEYAQQHNKSIRKFKTSALKQFKQEAVLSNSATKRLKDILSHLEQELTIEAPLKETPKLLNFDSETTAKIRSIHVHVNGAFKESFELLKKQEKDLRIRISRLNSSIKSAEGKNKDSYTQRLQEERHTHQASKEQAENEREKLLLENERLQIESNSTNRILSEIENKYKHAALEQQKYHATQKLLTQITNLVIRIKEEKKHALERSILHGLKQLMHKDRFVQKVRVRIDDNVMDIDLLDTEQRVIDKETLSKGEQQLYATALLKALVDESGISFPVFIDSPLQKFDRSHSKNVINNFYPHVSDQVVLFPLVEKELTKDEFSLLKPQVCDIYKIENQETSTIKKITAQQLFEEEFSHV